MPMTAQDELLAQLSEELLGYREGSPKDMLDKARQLRELEQVKELVDSKDDILEAADQLRAVLSDCGIQ